MDHSRSLIFTSRILAIKMHQDSVIEFIYHLEIVPGHSVVVLQTIFEDVFSTRTIFNRLISLFIISVPLKWDELNN